MKRRIFTVTACLLLCAIFVFSASAAAATPESSDIKPEAPRFTPSELYKHGRIKASIKKYKEINPDVYGWLIVPGTNINEPVAFSNKHNNYYLYRDWAGNEYPDITYQNWMNRPACATYLDYRVRFPETSWYKNTNSRNFVMYGHNWNNLRHDTLKVGNHPGYVMFAQLPSYIDPKFAQEHPHIYFSTANHEGIWRVFAVEYTELSTEFLYNSPNPTKEYFGELLEQMRKRSIYNFNVDVNSDDRIITLSTCTRANDGVGGEQRFIIVARLLREGESENDTIKLTTNKEYIAPKFNTAA